MRQKPPRWNIAPALVAPGSRRLWQGLAFLAPLWGNAGNGALLNSMGQPLAGANLTAGSTLQWRGTPYGPGAGISGASNLLSQDNIEFISTSDEAGAGDLTMIILANPIAESRISWGLAQGNVADNTNLWLGFNNAAGSVATATSGMFSFNTRNVNSNTNAVVSGAIDGKYHLFGGRRAGANVEGFVDGVLRATASGTIQDIKTGTLGFAIGQRPETTTFRIDTACTIVFAAAWNRALSNAEMRMLAIDPFCMFRPMAEWRGVWTPPGGDAVLAPADTLNSLSFDPSAMSQAHNLIPMDGFLAEGFETPGLFQAHLLPALDMHMASGFDSASPGAGAPGAPGFRISVIAGNSRRNKPAVDGRSVSVAALNRIKTITE
ncbi:MAG: hypothetical protein ABL951_00145 [Alphaproteobacteria bacterium]